MLMAGDEGMARPLNCLVRTAHFGGQGGKQPVNNRFSKNVVA